MAFRPEIWLFPIRLPEAVKVGGRSGGIFEQSEEGYGSLRLEAGRLEAAAELVNLVWFVLVSFVLRTKPTKQTT